MTAPPSTFLLPYAQPKLQWLVHCGTNIAGASEEEFNSLEPSESADVIVKPTSLEASKYTSEEESDSLEPTESADVNGEPTSLRASKYVSEEESDTLESSGSADVINV